MKRDGLEELARQLERDCRRYRVLEAGRCGCPPDGPCHLEAVRRERVRLAR